MSYPSQPSKWGPLESSSEVSHLKGQRPGQLKVTRSHARQRERERDFSHRLFLEQHKVRVRFPLHLFLEEEAKKDKKCSRWCSTLSKALQNTLKDTPGPLACLWVRVPPKHYFTLLKVISPFPPPFRHLPPLPTPSLHILYTHTPRLCSSMPVLVPSAHMSPPYIIVPFSSALVYILYTVYFKTDAVYICIHCMPVSVSIVCLPYLCSYHYLLLTL